MYAVILYSIGSPENLSQSCIRQFLNNFLSDRLVVKIPRVIWQPVLHNFILKSRPERLSFRYSAIFENQKNPYLTIHTSLAEKLNEALNLSEEGLALFNTYQQNKKEQAKKEQEIIELNDSQESTQNDVSQDNEESANAQNDQSQQENADQALDANQNENEQAQTDLNQEEATEEEKAEQNEQDVKKKQLSAYWQHQTIQPENAGSFEYTNNPIKSLSQDLDSTQELSEEQIQANARQPSFYSYSEDLLLTDEAIVLDNAQFKVYNAYAYIEPSLNTALMDARNDGAEQIIVLPLFPQFSSTTSLRPAYTLLKLKEQNINAQLKFIRSYADHPLYIKAIANKIQKHIDKLVLNLQQKEIKTDKVHLLFSYHSLPKSYIKLGDPYEEEVKKTTQAIVEQLNLAEQGISYSLAYQSKMGPMSWLKPEIEHEIKNILNQDKQHLLVVCPNFSVDCLETLYDIQRNIKIMFLNQGGDSFTYIPCLNDDLEQVELLKDLVQNHATDIDKFTINKLNIS